MFRGRSREKAARLIDVGFDVAVLPESSRLDLNGTSEAWAGKTPQNGISVLARGEFSVSLGPVDATVPWSIFPVKVRGPESFNLLAVWARQEFGYRLALDVALSTYRGFLTSRPSAVVGDFNDNLVFDRPKRSVNFSTIAERLESEFQQRSVYHSFFEETYGQESRPTHYFRWKEENPFHIDYIFASKSWRIETASVGSFQEWAEVSDHRPVVAHLSLD